MIDIDLQNHQNEVQLPPEFFLWLENILPLASQAVLAVSQPSTPIREIPALDIALIDQAASDLAHRQFMDIPGATDVITFPYGELLICPWVAVQQAAEHQEPIWRELLRYIVHGMLHLAGYDDVTPKDAEMMHQIQEIIVRDLPPMPSGNGLT
jgi:probable rRNA maturation factor